MASLLTTSSKLRGRSFNVARANQRARDRLLNSFAAAEAAGLGCLTVQDAGTMAARGRGFVGDAVEPLWPVSSRGLTFSHPSNWHLNPDSLALSTSLSLDTFFGEYRPNVVRPAGGAAIFVNNIPLPSTPLATVIQADRSPSEVVDASAPLTVGGEAATRITYHYQVSPDVMSRGVLVYVPHGNRLFKVFLDYYADDPAEASHLAVFEGLLSSVQFVP